ncbi:hypothetical protein FRC08_005990 [Ceratobasidium sp. 394]|nr:hypothetical protein FRC08_005990 [Ceratobasidium sp. 394]
MLLGSTISYRASRVRAIFSLPPRLQHLHPGPLVYLDVSTPFVPNSTSHCLCGVSQAYNNECPVSIVLPLFCVAMGCHIAPNFALPPTATPRFNASGTIFHGRHFFLNEFYNYFTYLLVAYWQVSPRPRQTSTFCTSSLWLFTPHLFNADRSHQN